MILIRGHMAVPAANLGLSFASSRNTLRHRNERRIETKVLDYTSMILLGIAFSLVPSAMWPSVPKIIPMKQLGSAFAIIFFIQNIGLMLVPMFMGKCIEFYTSADGRVDYTV